MNCITMTPTSLKTEPDKLKQRKDRHKEEDLEAGRDNVTEFYTKLCDHIKSACACRESQRNGTIRRPHIRRLPGRELTEYGKKACGLSYG